MEKIRVLVCDDMSYMCSVFKELLNNSETCVCIGIAHNERETVQCIREERPDVVLLDMQMDTSESGLTLIPIIHEYSPETAIIVISVYEDNEKIFKAIQLGAKDYLFKTTPPDSIISTIENIHKGREFLSSNVASRILEEIRKVERNQRSLLFLVNKMHSLSGREMEVLKYACKGEKYESIAEKINAEPVTVRTYVSRILKKMGYGKMADLVEDLKELGITEIF